MCPNFPSLLTKDDKRSSVLIPPRQIGRLSLCKREDRAPRRSYTRPDVQPWPCILSLREERMRVIVGERTRWETFRSAAHNGQGWRCNGYLLSHIDRGSSTPTAYTLLRAVHRIFHRIFHRILLHPSRLVGGLNSHPPDSL